MGQKNKWLKWMLIIIGIVAIIVYVLPKIESSKEIAGDEIEVKSGDISTYYSFSGSIEAKNRQTIFAEQAVQIEEFNVNVGDIVQKDDILYKTNRGVDVKSEINGEILDIFVQEDEQLMPGAKIIEIVDYKNLQLNVKVDEYDLKTIKKETPVNITMHALNKEFKGIVTDVAKGGENMNGVTFFDTKISIENPEDILVGMSSEAKVLNKSANNIAILPITAVKFMDNNSPYVNIKQDGKVVEQDIELGITDGVNVEIKSGLNIGDLVFTHEEAINNFGPPEGVREISNTEGEN